MSVARPQKSGDDHASEAGRVADELKQIQETESATEEQLRESVENIDLRPRDYEYIIRVLHQTEAVRLGHWELRSGWCSDMFMFFRNIVQFPLHLQMLNKLIASKFWSTDADAILAASRAGSYYGAGVATELSLRLELANVPHKKAESASFLDGFGLESGERVILVNDMSTTGRGLISLRDLAQENQCEVVGVGLFACRFPGGLAALQDYLLPHLHTRNIHALVEFAGTDHLFRGEREFLVEPLDELAFCTECGIGDIPLKGWAHTG